MYHLSCGIRLEKAEDRDQDRRATQMEIGNSELDASKKLEEMNEQIAQLEQELKDVRNQEYYNLNDKF